MPETGTDPIKMNSTLLALTGELAKITALREQMARGDAGMGDKGSMRLMREYIGNVSRQAARLGDDIDEIAPGVMWDNVRKWGERLAQMADSEVMEIASEIVPALDKAVDQAMSAAGRDEPEPEQARMPEAVVAGPPNGRIRMDGTRQVAETEASTAPVRMDGQRSGAPRRRRGMRAGRP